MLKSYNVSVAKKMVATLSSEPTSMNGGFQLCDNSYTHADLHQPLLVRDLYRTF